jgi:hypothetical protein
MANTNNAKQAFDQYVMWIANYPGDFKGATEAASDFIDTTEELDQLEALIRKAAGKSIGNPTEKTQP